MTTEPPPLLRLLLWNLNEAVRLGFIDNSSLQATAFGHTQIDSWPVAAPADAQLQRYREAMKSARLALDAQHRPWQSTSPRPRSIATVMQLSRFASRFADQIAAPHLVTTLSGWLDSPMADATAWHNLQSACLGFSATFGAVGGAHPARGRVKAKAINLHSGGNNTWVAPQPKAVVNSGAQHWRDRLGLIHLKGRTAPQMRDALVRVEFACDASSNPIDRRDWKSYIKDHSAGVWLIRPTIVHQGNERFVQGHGRDGPHDWARRYGMTRDLASPVHGTGERETLLICGDDAELRFRSVVLLDGEAAEDHGRDNTDATFVQNISSELKWTTDESPEEE